MVTVQDSPNDPAILAPLSRHSGRDPESTPYSLANPEWLHQMSMVWGNRCNRGGCAIPQKWPSFDQKTQRGTEGRT